jgi:BirA family transcriptional regulator, biotin operon repressor / biotin---[acetyl-CoA-carboxylase] ligase
MVQLMPASQEGAPEWRQIEVDEVDSTNLEMIRQAEAGLIAPGTALMAGRQYAGRGRHGRNWVPALGNLYLSCLIEDREHFGPSWSLLAGIAVHRAITGLAPELAATLRLKWPNDLMLADRKLGGILIERAGQAEPWWLVIGIGLNLKQPEGVENAAGLDSVLPQLTPAVMRDAILHQFEACRLHYAVTGMPGIRAGWLEHAWRLGGEVSCHVGTEKLTGRFIDLNVGGGLVLQLPGGETRRITGGEVHFAEAGEGMA